VVYVEYCSVIKKNEMLFLGKWMELEIIMLSEIYQVQKAKFIACFHSFEECSPKMTLTIVI
jgi:hypothetical protein